MCGQVILGTDKKKLAADEQLDEDGYREVKSRFRPFKRSPVYVWCIMTCSKNHGVFMVYLPDGDVWQVILGTDKKKLAADEEMDEGRKRVVKIAHSSI